MNKTLAKYLLLVEEINHRALQLQDLSNDNLRSAFLRTASSIGKKKSLKRALTTYLTEVYAVIKETARRFSLGNIIVTANDYDIYLAEHYDFVKIENNKVHYKNTWDVSGVPFHWNMVHYDEQILGGILLHYGYAVEMATGEGKTLVATLPIALNALSHNGVHHMTANDYLSKRDFETTRPIYMFHGLTTDCIEKYPRSDKRRKQAYQADITFGTNSSFTFDYLFDHLSTLSEECMQDKHSFAIIDELDSILIDDAETPHIVGGGNYYNEEDVYKENFPIVQELVASDNHSSLFTSSKLNKKAYFTNEGEKWLAEKKKLPNLFTVKRTYEIAEFDSLSDQEKKNILQRIYTQNVLSQLLHAITVYERDVDYIVADGKIKIIDQNTGRTKENNRWEHGLHTAIEVKENVKVQSDFDGLAVISLKNYFMLYDKIAGMSGTIMPARKELSEIYHLKCVALPTHKPTIRDDKPLRIYHTIEEKDTAIVDFVHTNRDKGRPTLIGCQNLKRSDHVANLLEEHHFPFNRLDARTTKGEAILVAKAGIGNTITVSTSVAGRGTDIKPSEDAIANGGLMVIGTDLFDSVRIDRQLKGRSGRQGNPGTSVFFASLEDNILNYLNTNDKNKLSQIGRAVKDTADLSRIALPYFEKAQKNREAISLRNRQNVAKKDDIVAPRRYKFYEQRNHILFDATAADTLVNRLISSKSIPLSEINGHLSSLYEKVEILINRYLKNNPNTTTVLIPFSDDRHPFAIRLDAQKTKRDPNYFYREFKRQSVLQLYDKNWKKFVIYMMGNLDSHEIALLDEKYDSMMDNINVQIISRLTNSTILFETKNRDTNPLKLKSDNQRKQTKNNRIDPESPCPCGSGKKFCKCHGYYNRRSSHSRKRR